MLAALRPFSLAALLASMVAACASSTRHSEEDAPPERTQHAEWRAFLAAQDADGSWDPSWTPAWPVGLAPGADSDRFLVTALWTLVFVPERADEHRRIAAEGLAWLRASEDESVEVRARAAATLAFVHALDADDVGPHDEFAEAAHHAADALEDSALPDGGWANTGVVPDAAATAWASLALERAHALGLGDRSVALRRAADAFAARDADGAGWTIAALLVESRMRPVDPFELYDALARLDPQLGPSSVAPETVVFACVLIQETRHEARGIRFARSAAVDAVSRRLHHGGPLDQGVEPWPWRDADVRGGALGARVLGALAQQCWLGYRVP